MKAKDLARQLGVSPATISLVLNNKPGISDSLRQSLIRQIRELGCGDMLDRGAPAPSADRPGERPTIAYLSYLEEQDWDDSTSFFPGVLEGAEMEARETGCKLAVLHPKLGGSPTLRELIADSGRVIGAIVQNCGITPELLRELDTVPIPKVFMDVYDQSLDVSSVNVNNRKSMMNTVNYLVGLGHREIGYVYSGAELDYCRDRRYSFRRALAEARLPENQANYFCSESARLGYDHSHLVSLFRQAERLPTALVCEGDPDAIMAVRALQELGRSVPQDVSVIGFDNSRLCTMIRPHLTSVRNSRHLMGRECVLQLMNLRHLEEQGFHATCLKYLLPTELILRDTVAPPKGERE